MKLWIDDIRPAPDESWTIARTVTSAINFIHRYRKELEVVSFDHDISYQIQVGELSRPYPSPETFVPAAQFLAVAYSHTEFKERPKVHIHTANPVGKDALVDTLAAGFDVAVNMMGVANRLEQEV